MALERDQRRMAAILVADVVGYSRLISGDEETTLATLRAYRQIVDRLIAQHHGRVFGSAGDSVIAEFASPVEAVRCATEIQLELDRQNGAIPESGRLRFRIGINLGDVVVDGDNLMGDGVNVAARLEALSQPGGLCVSEAVYAQARDRLALDFIDLGEHRLKNIARPVRAYRVPLASEEQLSSPFRGLDVFEFENADLFFGRARVIAACSERLQQLAANNKAFLLIYGMSGSGKSSLLRAGLLPSIIRPGAVAGISLWRRCLIRPSEGPDAVASLVAGLFREGALPELELKLTALELTQLCRSAPYRALAPIRRAIAKAAAAAGSVPSQLRLIVAVDQMEELFTMEKEPASRGAFVRLLAALAGSGLVWVIATIRSDFFHRCGEVPGFSELKDGLGSYEVLPPTGPEIAQIIREPARAVGLRFEETADQGRLDDVLQEAAAADPGSLPLLEFVLDALYEVGREHRTLTFAAYRALGGLEGAVARRADEVVDALPLDIQEALPAVLRALTTVRPGDEAVTARPVLLTEVAGTAARRSLVDALVAARLLVSDEDASGRAFVRVAHEALLSRWPRARDIVNANKNFLETRARLKADAHRWHADDRNRELLLPSGKRLAEGEELLASRREEVDEEVVEYIDASSLAERALIEAAEAAKRERLERETERARRTRIAAVVASVLALLAAAGAFVGFRGQKEASRQAELAQMSADKAKLAEQQALSARDAALRNQSLSLSLLSQQTAASGDTEAAILLALEALPTSTSSSSRPYIVEAEIALYRALLVHYQTKIFQHAAGVTQATFSPSGDRIVTSSYDKTARIWDVSSGKETAVLRGHEGPVERAEFSPDESRVITAARDGTARIWDAISGKELFVLQPVGNFPTAIFSRNGNQVLTAGDNSNVSLWDARTGIRVLTVGSKQTSGSLASFSPDDRTFASSERRTVFIWNASDGTLAHAWELGTWPSRLAFSPDGSRLLINAFAPFSYANFSALWDVSKGTEIARLEGHQSDTHLQGVVFSHDGRRIATVSLDGTARLWDGISGQLRGLLGQESAGLKLSQVGPDERDLEVNSAFSPDDRLLATASFDGRVRVWDVARASLLATISGHSSLVEHLEFSPIDNSLLTASHDGTARLWDTDGVLTTTLFSKNPRSFAAFSPDNVHLVTGGAGGVAHLWEVAGGHEIATLGPPGERIRDAAFSPDGRRIAIASQNGRILVWDVAARHQVALINSRFALPADVQFSPDGGLLAAGSFDGEARLWDAETGTEVTTIKTSAKLPHAVFSPDGDLVLAVTNDNSARLLKTDGTELKVLAGHQNGIKAAAFSPDGLLVATGSFDGTARIWSVKDGNTVATLKGHTDRLTDVMFSGDGQSLLTASSDGTARIWSVSDGKEKVILTGHSGVVTSARFSPNGLYVVTASSQDRTVRLWAAQSGRLIAVLASRQLEADRPVPTRADFNFDGTRIVVLSGEESVRVIRIFRNPEELIAFAKKTVPRELTACERRRYFLPVKGDVGDCPS